MIFLPASGRYTMKLKGQQPGSATLRLQQLLDDQVAQSVLYFDLPITANSLAVLPIDPANPAGTFALDQDGNGSSEAVFPPSQVLDARESQDGTPPHTRGQLAGAISPQGSFQNPVTVTLEAQDEAGGSGVARPGVQPGRRPDGSALYRPLPG